MDISISIIIPAYNEENRISGYLDTILTYLNTEKYLYEIIIVDDGSTDATASVVNNYIARNPNIKLITLPHNCGKGCAVKTGMIQATGTLRLFTDADGATPITELQRLRNEIDHGADVAIGSRAKYSNDCVVKGTLHRRIMGSVFNLLVQALMVKNISDTQCGFKLFTAKAASTVFPLQSISGFGFDVEILFICDRKGFTIKEVPVNWSEIPRSKVKLFQDSIKMFLDIFKIRINYLKGIYNS